jgi:hypothetical protein
MIMLRDSKTFGSIQVFAHLALLQTQKSIGITTVSTPGDAH